MGLGDKPLAVNRRHSNEDGYWTVYVLNTTGHQEPPYCPHRGNLGECDAWAPCMSDYRPSARAWGPGFNADEIERRSDNAFLLVFVIHDTNPQIGSPSGHYRVCVAPREDLIGTQAGTCREYDFTAQ